MSDNFKAIWQELMFAGIPDTARRVAPNAIVHQYVGVDIGLLPSYVLMTTCEPFSPEDLQALQVVRSQTSNGSWVMKITLTSAEFMTEFDALCVALASASESSENEALALNAMKNEYENWLRFFKASTGITLAEARGLFAELVVLKYLAGNKRHNEVIESWVGPSRADQDFQFANGVAVEVKSLLPSSTKVQIASENQLDYAGELLLALVTVLQVDDNVTGSTVRKLVEQITRCLSSSLLVQFQAKLRQARFSLTSTFCSDTLFAVQSGQVAEASAPLFPKLTSSSIPPGIRNVAYSIELNGLNKYLVCEVSELEQRVF